MRTRSVVVTSAAVGICLAALGVAAGVTAQPPSTAGYVVSQLRAEPTRADALAAGMVAEDLGVEGLRTDSTRFLGATKEAKFWVGVDNADNICVIALLPSGVAGASCNLPERVEKFGLLVGVSGNEELKDPAIVAQLLPDSAEVRDVPKWQKLGPNLLVALQEDVTETDATILQREAGKTGDVIVVHG